MTSPAVQFISSDGLTHLLPEERTINILLFYAAKNVKNSFIKLTEKLVIQTRQSLACLSK